MFNRENRYYSYYNRSKLYTSRHSRYLRTTKQVCTSARSSEQTIKWQVRKMARGGCMKYSVDSCKMPGYYSVILWKIIDRKVVDNTYWLIIGELRQYIILLQPHAGKLRIFIIQLHHAGTKGVTEGNEHTSCYSYIQLAKLCIINN